MSNVIWCTGYAPDYDDRSLADNRNRFPVHDRGIVESCPGLYFVGLLFLYSLSSALLGGVGRDADHIVDHVVSTRPARMRNSWQERAEVMAGGNRSVLKDDCQGHERDTASINSNRENR